MLGQKSFIQPSVYYKVQVGSCILLELYEAKNELPLFMKFFLHSLCEKRSESMPIQN